jgi:hypothetical protein
MAKVAPAADELIEDLSSPAQEQPEDPVRASKPDIQAKVNQAVNAILDNPDVLTRAAEATTKTKVKPFVFDDVSGVLTVNDAHGSFETSLMGINPRVEWQLAAIGLASLLKGRIDKDKVIENIKAGQFGGKRKHKYPLTVIAYANFQNITIQEAWEQWQALSVPDRMQLKSMPKIRLELAKLADAAESK